MGFEGFSSHLKKNTQCAHMRKTNRERFNEEKIYRFVSELYERAKYVVWTQCRVV